MKRIFRKVPQSVYTFMSLSALAAVNYSIIHSSFVFIAILVLFAHELGHYFMAKKEGAYPSLPIFLPLPFIAIGLTRIQGLCNKSKMRVALSGPLFGVITAALILLFNIIFNITSNILILSLIVGEILFNTIGNDGAKYRRAKKEMLVCTS